jgi:radical SAM protein with 4Fe4S-binding SPASM domain
MSNFCKAPFTQMSIDPRGAILPCCRYPKPLAFLKDERIDEAWNNDNFKDLRAKFLNDEKPDECKDCWLAEDSGNESLRSVVNGWAEDYDFDSPVVEDSPLYYEFKTTNVCNLKCRMCGSFNSSSIAKESEPSDVRNFYSSNKILGTHHEQKTFEWIENAKHILFAGGEPFVNPEIKKLVEYLDNKQLHDKSLLIVTNGTHWNDDFIGILKKFTNLDVRISLDDIYERNDYQREGSDFYHVEKNIVKFLKTFGKKVTFNCTINWYNVFYIDEFFEFSDDLGVPVSVQYVTNPNFLNIVNLPNHAKNKINNKFVESKDTRIQLILERLNLKGENLIDKFKYHIEFYDNLRTNDFNVAFPEWCKILHDK